MVKQLVLLFFILNLNTWSQNMDSLRQVATRLPHDTDRVTLFYNEGFAWRSTDPQYSYDCAREAERYAQHASQPYYAAKAFNLLGILYYRKGDLVTALSYHKKALELRTVINDRKGIALSQTNLGNVFSDMGLYRQAETAYLKALQLNTDLGEQLQAGNCLLNLGTLFAELKKPALAKNYFNLALANSRLRFFDYELQAACYNNLAEISLQEQDDDAAIAHCMNSLKIKELMDNDMEMADSYLALASAYLHKNDLPQGKSYLHLADSLIVLFNYGSARFQTLSMHARYHAQEKNFEAAYQSLAQALQLKDSMEVAAKFAAPEAGFSEVAMMEQTPVKETQPFPYFYFWLLVVVMLGGALWLLRFKR